MSDPVFHGLEDYSIRTDSRKDVVCLFKTDRLGIYQVEYTKLKGAWRLKPLPQEPNLQMLTKSEQLHIEKVCRIVWRLVHDAPASTERFK